MPSTSNYINPGDHWRQRKGKVRLEVIYYCNAGCVLPDGTRRADHVHVRGWRTDTLAPTQHSMIPVDKLRKEFELVP